MTPREIVAKLKAAGFELFKRGSRHDLYKKGDFIQPVARAGNGSSNPRAVKSLNALLRRIERGQGLPPGRYV